MVPPLLAAVSAAATAADAAALRRRRRLLTLILLARQAHPSATALRPSCTPRLFKYEHLAHIIGAFFGKSERLLIPGCGNAPFSPDLYAAGFERQVNIDTSSVVIEQQRERHPQMEWEVGDCMAMEHEDGSFDGCIDKSLVDTLMCAPGGSDAVRALLADMSRCVRPGGFVMLLSLHCEVELLECILPEVSARH